MGVTVPCLPPVYLVRPSVGVTVPFPLSAGIVALWSLAVLAFERYFVICRPLKDVRLDNRHAAMGLLFVWSFSFIWTVPPLFGWSSYTVSKIGTTCEPNW